jgi:hypothetical protein
MGCPESLATLQRIEQILKKDNYVSELYDTLCSLVGTIRKTIVDDDLTLPEQEVFSEITVKVRSLGTNTYIAIGAAATPAFRFTGASQSHTFVAPVMYGNVIPFAAKNIVVVGDGATGVLEITGIKIMRSI